MASTFNWAQSNGAGNTVSELGSSGNIMNFQSADVATPLTYSSNVVTAGDTTNTGNSYELWIRGHWQSTFNSVSNLKFWKSVEFSPATGITTKYGCTATYATPTQNDSNITTGQVNTGTCPTSTPASNNVSIANSLSGSLTAAGYSDYMVLQNHAGTTAPQGDSSLATFTIQWDET